MRKRLLSGVKPTGQVHIGNYFGAMQQFVALQDEYESFIFIADLHALTQIKDSEEMSQYVLEVTKSFLAIGLNPEKVVLFRQSDINPITELCWILNCITSVGLLKRAHAYKDALTKKKLINVGLFDYPVLMATDILIYKSNVVPVGQDQQQHIETTQEIAKKFNKIYGNVFRIPKGIIRDDVATIKGLDGRKMSKSYKNTIGLFDSRKEIEKKIMSVAIDSDNILSYHKLFSENDVDRIGINYKKGLISHRELKELLIDNMDKFLKPIREKKQELDKNPDYIIDVLKKGREKALKIASQTLKEVKIKLNLL